jgi:basic amino acid/polyamine antiporter, APA family
VEWLFSDAPITLPVVSSSPASGPAALRRELGLVGAVALGIGGTVGGGVYVLVGVAAAEAGPAALISFAVAFAMALLIGLAYAELACRHPVAGGGYAFVRAAFGPSAGFAMGWGFWGAYLFISGYVTLGFGGYLEALTGLPAPAGALGLVATCLALNLAGLRVAGAAQVAVTGLALAGLVAFAAWGLPDVGADRLDPFLPAGLGGVLIAALPAFLAFGGFDMIAAAGEEVSRPERTLPRAILITLAAVAGLYLAVCIVAIGVMSSAALGGSSAPLAEAAERFGGEGARRAVVVTALLTTAATANAVLVVTSRISFAMARDGLLPRGLASVDRRTGAPWAALAVSGALLAAVAAAGSIERAAAVGGVLYVLHFAVPLAGLVALRRRGVGEPAFTTPAPRLVIPLALAACGELLVASGLAGAGGALAWLALGALGLGARLLLSRRRERRR